MRILQLAWVFPLLSIASPALASPREVSLDDVRAAVDQAPAHVAAQRRTVAAFAEAEAAGPWPATTVSIGTARESSRLVAVASIPLPLFGVARAIRRAARADAEVTRAEEPTTDVDLRGRATVAWLALYGAGQVAQVTQEGAERLDGLVEVTRARRDAGDASEADVVNAETQAARAHVEAEDAALSVGLAGTELAAVVGWAPAEELVATGPLPSEAPTDEGLASDLAYHPELRVQEARIAAAASAVSAARAASRPTLRVNLEVDTFDPNSGATNLLVDLTVDLPLWGRGRAREHAARARVSAEEAEANALRSQLAAELVAAQRRWAAGRRRAASFGTKLVPAQERSTELVRKAYAAGEVDLAAVIQSERDLLDVRAEALAAELAAAEAWATLERAAGGAL